MEDLNNAKKELSKLSNKELLDTYLYYKSKSKRLGVDEYKYLIAIEREINKRGL